MRTEREIFDLIPSVANGVMIKKIGHGRIHLFIEGGHPAMLTSPTEFFELSMEFFKQ